MWGPWAWKWTWVGKVLWHISHKDSFGSRVSGFIDICIWMSEMLQKDSWFISTALNLPLWHFVSVNVVTCLNLHWTWALVMEKFLLFGRGMTCERVIGDLVRSSFSGILLPPYVSIRMSCCSASYANSSVPSGLPCADQSLLLLLCAPFCLSPENMVSVYLVWFLHTRL
jgi:hypothetical protein